MRKFFVYACLLWGLIGSAGCGSTPVADDVGQREANEIVAVLRQRGIDAAVARAKGSKAHYSVSVASDSFGEAASVLTRLGLPAEKKSSFEEMTATNGIIPSSREVEALRVDRAVASEVEQLIQARGELGPISVVVRYRSIEGHAAPSISIVAQRQGKTSLNEAELRAIAAKAVPGVRAEDIFVSLADAPQWREEPGACNPMSAPKADIVPFLGFWSIPASEYGNIAWLFVGFIVFTGGLAGVGGYIMGQFNGLNRQAAARGAPDKSIRRGGNRMERQGGDEFSDSGGEE